MRTLKVDNLGSAEVEKMDEFIKIDVVNVDPNTQEIYVWDT